MFMIFMPGEGCGMFLEKATHVMAVPHTKQRKFSVLYAFPSDWKLGKVGVTMQAWNIASKTIDRKFDECLLFSGLASPGLHGDTSIDKRLEQQLAVKGMLAPESNLTRCATHRI
jgi:hypothetical protein